MNIMDQVLIGHSADLLGKLWQRVRISHSLIHTLHSSSIRESEFVIYNAATVAMDVGAHDKGDVASRGSAYEKK